MANPEPDPTGEGFEQLKRLLEQLGLGGENVDLEQLLKQVAQMQANSPFGVGLTNADRDPDAAWLTTVTAAKKLCSDQAPDPDFTAEERLAIVDADRLAQSWLGNETEFTAPANPAEALTRAGWLDQISGGLRGMVDPIINGLAEALERGTQFEDDSEMSELSQLLAPMMRTSASLIYRDRLAKVLAGVAQDILTGTELGVNLFKFPKVAVLPSNLAEFTRDLELPEADILIYLLVREGARIRLFNHVSWLMPQIDALLAHYAREIRIDFEALSEQFDPTSMTEISLEAVIEVGEKVRGSFFKPASTPTQLEILERLEILLALVEGWVDHLTSRATSKWMPAEPQLKEMVRRRRAAAGPVESIFGDLLGLSLRPKLVREAENLWAAIEHSRGVAGRDSVWSHPDLLPTAQHLSDPLSFEQSSTASENVDELDVELRRLLEDD